MTNTEKEMMQELSPTSTAILTAMLDLLYAFLKSQIEYSQTKKS